MKRIFRLPGLAGGVVMAAVLASLAPITSSRVYAQVTAYYYPYGQGPYGGYGQVYVTSSRVNAGMFPNFSRTFGNRAYGYSGYEHVPSGYGYEFNYGIGSQVRAYGGSSYYQPSYGPVYVPFGYRDY